MSSPKLGTAELLFRSAEELGLQPIWVMPGSVLAIQVAGKERYLNLARSPLNSHLSISLSVDKYLTRLVFARHKLANIPFARATTQAEANLFLESHGTIIAKPVGGSGSRDIHIISTEQQLQALVVTNYILEKYIVGPEMRYLILDGSVIGVYQSDYGVSVQSDRVLRCLALPQTSWNPALVNMAIQATGVLGLGFAAVDFIIGDSGPYILEVNTTPDLKWFHAPSSGPAVDVARLFLESIVQHYAAQTPNFVHAEFSTVYAQIVNMPAAVPANNFVPS